MGPNLKCYCCKLTFTVNIDSSHSYSRMGWIVARFRSNKKIIQEKNQQIYWLCRHDEMKNVLDEQNGSISRHCSVKARMEIFADFLTDVTFHDKAVTNSLSIYGGK